MTEGVAGSPAEPPNTVSETGSGGIEFGNHGEDGSKLL